MSTTNARVLVFGGSGELGTAVCRLLAGEECRFAFTYFQNKARADEIQSQTGAVSLAVDLRDAGAVTRVVQEAIASLGGLDAVIFAAGVSGGERFYLGRSDDDFDRLAEIKDAEFDETLNINARGAFAVCRAAAPELKKNGGNIVVVGSMDGVKTMPSPVHFAVSKAALRGLVESLSKELGPKNVRVNLIAPGILESGQADELADELKNPYLKFSSVGRFGRMEEVAEVIVWFALENTYITGQPILLDGGL